MGEQTGEALRQLRSAHVDIVHRSQLISFAVHRRGIHRLVNTQLLGEHIVCVSGTTRQQP